VGSEHVCYLFCGWRFGGIFYRILTYFNKVKNNVGVKFVMVPNGYMVPNGNTYRFFLSDMDGGSRLRWLSASTMM
jgi:hypothetical protein